MKSVKSVRLEAIEALRRVEMVDKRASKVEVAEKRVKFEVKVEAKCLKEMLEKAEAELASKNKRRWMAQERVAKAEKKIEGQAIEATHWTVEAF